VHINEPRAATAEERVRAEAAGLPMPAEATCFTWRDAHGSPLAYGVVLAGVGERRVRTVAAADFSDPRVAEAVVSLREVLLGRLAERAQGAEGAEGAEGTE